MYRFSRSLWRPWHIANGYAPPSDTTTVTLSSSHLVLFRNTTSVNRLIVIQRSWCWYFHDKINNIRYLKHGGQQEQNNASFNCLYAQKRKKKKEKQKRKEKATFEGKEKREGTRERGRIKFFMPVHGGCDTEGSTWIFCWLWQFKIMYLHYRKMVMS